jgi:hypothetical protein
MDTSNFKDILGYDFHFEIIDPELKDNLEVKEWLDESEQIIKTELIKENEETIKQFLNSKFCSEEMKKLLAAN